MVFDVASAGVVAVIRQPVRGRAERIAEALAGGGVVALEVALTTPGALDAIRALRGDLPAGVAVGAGTVRGRAEAAQAIEAGAGFLVTPAVRLDVLEVARAAGVPAVCGAMTPTEALTAWEAGATAVKLFPARSLGGPAFLTEIRAPLPHIPFVPTGGVDLDDLPAYAAAGAVAVAVGGALMPARLTEPVDAEGLRALAATFLRAWRAAVRSSSRPNGYGVADRPAAQEA